MPDHDEALVEAAAWAIHRAYGCGPHVTPGGPGPVCEPDNEDYAAAEAVVPLVAAQATAELRQRVEAELADWPSGGARYDLFQRGWDRASEELIAAVRAALDGPGDVPAGESP